MNIRTRLTLMFIADIAVILGIASIAILYFFADHRKEDFYNRLRSKANNTAKLLIQVEEVDAALLTKIEHDNPVSLQNEKIIIYDKQDHVVYSSDAGTVPVASSVLSAIRQGKEAQFELGEYEVLGITLRNGDESFVVIAAATDTFGKRKQKALLHILIVTFVASITIVSFAGWIYSGRALMPISRVVDQVKNISETSLNTRVDEGNKSDEVGKLARTFNDLLNRLEKAFNAQKSFIANASHELRTPLTSITGKIEVALLQPRTPEQYEEVLISLLGEVRNLNQLSNRLLMLAQTSAEAPTGPGKLVRIDELVWQAQEDVNKSSRDYTVDVDFDLGLDDELLTVAGDEQLLRVAVTNLMENGCKYSSDHRVGVTVGVKDGGVCLSFADNGIGIPLDEQQRIFHPFYRGRNAKHKSGHGIGLSLVSRIVKLHHGTLTFTSAENKGSVFELFLPLKHHT